MNDFLVPVLVDGLLVSAQTCSRTVTANRFLNTPGVEWQMFKDQLSKKMLLQLLAFDKVLDLRHHKERNSRWKKLFSAANWMTILVFSISDPVEYPT